MFRYFEHFDLFIYKHEVVDNIRKIQSSIIPPLTVTSVLKHVKHLEFNLTLILSHKYTLMAAFGAIMGSVVR